MMCAFMTPVLRDDWELYPKKGKRSRTSSENSQKSTPNLAPKSRSDDLRRHCLGDQRSSSYHAVPRRNDSDLSYIKGQARAYQSVKNSRTSSRTSFKNLDADYSASHIEQSNASLGKKNKSTTSLNKFHNRVMDKLKNVLHKKGDEKCNQENDTNEDTSKS